MKLNEIPDPKQDPVMLQEKCYTEHYLVNWQNWNMINTLEKTVKFN